jgi:uncharacterized iron-regulated membrane protein
MNEARTTTPEPRVASATRAKLKSPRFLRRWHRWIGVPAAIFLLFASTTGILVAFTEFFGEEEALREATRDMVSPVSLDSPESMWRDPLIAAFATAAREAGGAPIDKVILQLKGPKPTVDIFLGKPGGGEDRRLVIDARTGELVEVASYVDKPFLYRLHSGEAFGDGGLVVAMFWGLALALMTISGALIYLRMLRPNVTGLRRYFW